ncbi:MAG: 4Fe-4S dicluster domain-containing protein [Gordonibacter pamelaeae]
MPDLIAIAERLAERPPVAALDGGRCLRVRDRESSCAACAEACPVGAVAVRAAAVEEAAPYGSVDAVRDAGPRIDDEACVRCGACVAACPTNALLALPPLDDGGLFAQVDAAGTAARERADAGTAAAGTSNSTGEEAATPVEPPTAGFACERLAQTLRLEGDRIVVLPCLAWVDVALLVHLACNGAERIAVPLDACPSCELADAAELVRAAVENARRICAVAGIDAAFETTDGAGLRDLEAAPEADATGELSRRSLFTQAGASLLDTAREEAARQLESLAGAPVSDDAPIEPDTRRWQLLDDLHAAGLTDDAAVVPRARSPRA